MDEFLTWLSHHESLFDNVEIKNSTNNERGVFATNDIHKGEIAVAIPTGLALSSSRATKAPLGQLLISEFGSIMQSYEEFDLAVGRQILIWTLTLEKLRRTSDWLPWFKVLPSDFNTPLHWTPSEQKLLRGTNLFAVNEAMEEKLRDCYMDVWPKLRRNKRFLDLFCDLDTQQVNFEEFKWSSSLMHSRAFIAFWDNRISESTEYLFDEQDGGQMGVMGKGGEKELQNSSWGVCPLLDCLNHERGVSITWRIGNRISSEDDLENNSWQTTQNSIKKGLCLLPGEEFLSEDLMVELRVGQDIKRGEEICNNYGSRSNSSFLLYYGFVLDDNPEDTLVLKIGCPEKNFHLRKVLMRGLDQTQKIAISRYTELHPWNPLLHLLRIVTVSDWKLGNILRHLQNKSNMSYNSADMSFWTCSKEEIKISLKEILLIHTGLAVRDLACSHWCIDDLVALRALWEVIEDMRIKLQPLTEEIIDANIERAKIAKIYRKGQLQLAERCLCEVNFSMCQVYECLKDKMVPHYSISQVGKLFGIWKNWIEQNGGRVSFVPYIDGKVTIANDLIKPQDTVLCIPTSCCISISNVLEHKIIGSALTQIVKKKPECAYAILLLYMLHNCQNDWFSPFLNCLAINAHCEGTRPYHMMLLNKSQLQQLKSEGVVIGDAIENMRATYFKYRNLFLKSFDDRLEFNSINEVKHDESKGLEPKELSWLKKNDYLWAISLVKCRLVFLSNASQPNNPVFLPIPYVPRHDVESPTVGPILYCEDDSNQEVVQSLHSGIVWKAVGYIHQGEEVSFCWSDSEQFRGCGDVFHSLQQGLVTAPIKMLCSRGNLPIEVPSNTNHLKHSEKENKCRRLSVKNESMIIRLCSHTFIKQLANLVIESSLTNKKMEDILEIYSLLMLINYGFEEDEGVINLHIAPKSPSIQPDKSCEILLGLLLSTEDLLHKILENLKLNRSVNLGMDDLLLGPVSPNSLMSILPTDNIDSLLMSFAMFARQKQP
eukprot:GHVL01033497.1.p1 GENE.GHVL01033497.1~~GHVL01033497.1.p1  ORF type:complete len:995 (+),score=120.87 GHVL01033497.1:26-3010(+)